MVQQVALPPKAAGQRRSMSIDEWLAWADEEGPLTEWVDGEAIVFEMPTERHQDIVGFLYVLLLWYTHLRDLGKVYLAPLPLRILDGSRWREPDLLFVAKQHADRRRGNRIEGPADLVVEVVSDDSVRRDGETKLREYAAAGVPEYWLVDPRPGRQTADFFQLDDDGTYRSVPPGSDGRYRSRVLPGFSFDPRWLCQDPLPYPDIYRPLIAPESEVAAG